MESSCERFAPPFAARSPRVSVCALGLDASARYVLMMTDPDAPPRATPAFCEFVHWCVCDVPAQHDWGALKGGSGGAGGAKTGPR